MKTKELSVALLLILSLSACGPVVDVNSIDRAKVQQDIQKMKAVEGTYSGAITSKKTGQTIGFAALTLSTDSVIYTPPTDPRSQIRSVLRATMDVQLPERKLSFNFNESYYDVESHDLIVGYNSAAAVAQLGNGNNPGFKLSGKHADGTVTGEIHAGGFPGEGLLANLQLNGPSLESSMASIASDGAPATLMDQVERKYRLPERSKESKPLLTISAYSVSSEDEFWRLLIPYQPVNVSYSYGYDLHILFRGARWDSKSGRLTGEAQTIAAGAQTVIHNLDCVSTDGKTGRLSFPDALDCTITANNRGVVGQYKLISN